MKTLLLVACLLTISYAIDPEKVKKIFDSITTCAQELHVSEEYTPDVVKCSLQKHEMIDEQGLIIKEKVLENFNNIISDETKLRQAREIFSTCIEQANQGPGSNDEKTMAVIRCGTRVIYLFDKPQ
ncbi:unnamed protein product [Lasius platythorax]|uniref:Ant venom allergen Sol i 2/4 domain-containing protein n=1 Tax=Lasius platythorax TaxID=488582 RepID=A0AAV2N4X9_9HYME